MQVCAGVPAWRLGCGLLLGGSTLVGGRGFGGAGTHLGAGGPGQAWAELGPMEEAPGGAGRAAQRLHLQDGRTHHSCWF